MAKQGNPEKDKEGMIRDQDSDIRYDSGEALKDEYERADAYEKDKIELRGVVFFTLGLVLLIGVTFGLMALLQRAMEAQARATKDDISPLAYTEEDRRNGIGLPPEPRLQAAPGFEVKREDGTIVNLELREPQSEWRELRKDWNKVWDEGRKDPQTGTIITLPIEQAKQKVLQENLIKTRDQQTAQKAAAEVRMFPSYQSSGRDDDIRRQ